MPDQPLAPNANRIMPSTPPTNLPTGQAGLPTPAPMPRPTSPPPAPVPPPAPIAPVVPRPVPPLAPKPATPQAPAQSGYTSELRTMSADVNSLKVGQAPMGIKPPISSAPSTPTAPATPAPSIVVPPKSSGGGMFKKLAIGLLALVVVVVFGYIIITMIGGGTQEATPTPSPSASVSASPAAKLLRTYFGTPGSSINLQSSTTGTDDFLSGLATIQPAGKQAAVVTLQHAGSSASPLTFLNDTVGTVPASLSATFGSDWIVLIYGQTEHFSTAGALTNDSSVSNRPAVIIELTDASSANQSMQTWEGSGFAVAFAKLFQYNTSKQLVSGFSSGTYRQILVRYQNFSYADQSLDYGIVTASNNKNYLVITSSRESLFFTIDQLMQ